MSFMGFFIFFLYLIFFGLFEKNVNFARYRVIGGLFAVHFNGK